ncbi:MAG: hypothetical protein H6713_32970 [Myxococcales bacterium]|nr:hypothetical protein [Myxococcales bacterium]
MLSTHACRDASRDAAPLEPIREAGIPTLRELAVRPLTLAGPASAAEREFSGLDWYKDELVLLPQYPALGGGVGELYALSRADILARVDGELDAPLSPRVVEMATDEVRARVSGFQGFEAIAFAGDQVYLTIETGWDARGYLVVGRAREQGGSLAAIELDAASLTELPTPARIFNSGFEALTVVPGGALALYERNAPPRTPEPRALRVMATGQAEAPVTAPVATPMAAIEYRVTDASSLDAAGRFWVINYRFPASEDGVSPIIDALARARGRGPTHAGSTVVERLLELRYDPDAGVTLTDAAPIVLELAGASRNWEGLARLDGRGFLLVTDKFPGTELGYVPVDMSKPGAR